jgi:hypothetical protein
MITLKDDLHVKSKRKNSSPRIKDKVIIEDIEDEETSVSWLGVML